MESLRDKRVVYGTLASLLLLGFYVEINYLTGGFEAVYWNLRNYIEYIAIIDFGFGIQVALFTHIRQYGRSCNALAGTSVTGSSMVACCLHHVTDFIPFIGVGAGLFLSQLTEIFFMIGAASSIVGVAWMLSVIQKNRVYADSRLLAGIMKINYSAFRDALLVISVLAVIWKYFSMPYRIF